MEALVAHSSDSIYSSSGLILTSPGLILGGRQFMVLLALWGLEG